MCICLKKVSRCDWVSARHTSACITGLYVDFNLTRTDTATMTDYRQPQKTTTSDKEKEREGESARAAEPDHLSFTTQEQACRCHEGPFQLRVSALFESSGGKR